MDSLSKTVQPEILVVCMEKSIIVSLAPLTNGAFHPKFATIMSIADIHSPV